MELLEPLVSLSTFGAGRISNGPKMCSPNRSPNEFPGRRLIGGYGWTSLSGTVTDYGEHPTSCRIPIGTHAAEKLIRSCFGTFFFEFALCCCGSLASTPNKMPARATPGTVPRRDVGSVALGFPSAFRGARRNPGRLGIALAWLAGIERTDLTAKEDAASSTITQKVSRVPLRKLEGSPVAT
jgi:hypothetical protein